LTELKEQQLSELRSLEHTKEGLSKKAERLGDRLQSCHDSQEELLQR
jgi:hypothetical protein